MKINDAKDLINYLLDNNLKLVEANQDKITISLEGSHGIGKTSLIKQIAEERGAGYKRLNLSELEEIGDLVGIPSKEYIMQKDGDEKRVSEKLISQYIQLGYTLCPDCNPVMAYSIPEWVPVDEDKEFILYLDDFSRGNSLFMQAIMSLIQFGEYISWKLPKKTHLILSSNPDDGNYSVSSLDSAQQTRYLTLNLEFDVTQYAEWLDLQKVPDSFVNFILLNPEIFDRSNKVTARTYTMFANALRSISNLSSTDSLNLINTLSDSCFGNDTGIGGLFTQFINNKLDKLITPEQMLTRDWNFVCQTMLDNIYKDDIYRSDIASTLTIRFITYLSTYFNKTQDKKASDKVINRITEFVKFKDSLGRSIFTEDLLLKLISTITKKYPQRLQKLIALPEIREKLH